MDICHEFSININYYEKEFPCSVGGSFLCVCVILAKHSGIEPELKTVLGKRSAEPVSINIYFKSQIDRSSLGGDRDAVVASLKEFAMRVQGDYGRIWMPQKPIFILKKQ